VRRVALAEPSLPYAKIKRPVGAKSRVPVECGGEDRDRACGAKAKNHFRAINRDGQLSMPSKTEHATRTRLFAPTGNSTDVYFSGSQKKNIPSKTALRPDRAPYRSVG
jgi:hypothetical protein